MKDTPAEVDALFRTMVLAVSPAERVAMACRMFETAKALIRAGIEDEYGPLPPDRLREYMFLRLYGQDFGEEEKAKIISSLRLK